MENMGITDNLKSTYSGQKVLVTGDTGFKGTWLVRWLLNLGADVCGFSLDDTSKFIHYSLLKSDYKHIFGDVGNLDLLSSTLRREKPSIIFHLAAQSLVRHSYRFPLETYTTNLLGTANILDACRGLDFVKAIVVVTTDKVYENRGDGRPFVESDPMGGFDPYSSSKACSELLVSSYRSSYFNIESFNILHNSLIATVRAGNVIGGGDWSDDRLIPDLIKSTVTGLPAKIRYPSYTRPWQHVLDPLCGYLMLGRELLRGKRNFSGAWNFGPVPNEILTVFEVLKLAKGNWNKINFDVDVNEASPYEAQKLSLDINKARHELGWQPLWSSSLAVERTINWYRRYYETGELLTDNDISDYSILV
jgi:CDP-glucose 4,6-dehydratase